MKLIFAGLLLASSFCLMAQEKQIEAKLHQLRQLQDAERIKATRALALEIRHLPATAKKEQLAEQLANLVTEGDPGHDTLQEVATTLAQALRPQPVASAYVTLARLVRYEGVKVSSDDPQFAAAMKKLAVDDHTRQHADFTRPDARTAPQ